MEPLTIAISLVVAVAILYGVLYKLNRNKYKEGYRKGQLDACVRMRGSINKYLEDEVE